uniref:Trehalase n=1 Tax=Ditylenchus dipsaci TaxID=166011 RepID=A0A915CMD4_9BILA
MFLSGGLKNPPLLPSTYLSRPMCQLIIFSFIFLFSTVSTTSLHNHPAYNLRQRRAASVSNNELDVPAAQLPTHPLPNTKPDDDHLWKPLNQDVVVQMCDEENSNNSFIYCSGRILEAAMTYYFPNYNDSKTFVDKPLKYDAHEILQKFNKQFPPSTNQTDSVADINPDDLTKFIEENFDQESTELQSCYLNDWNERPAQLEQIQDKTLKEWAMDLNKIWKNLCRQINPNVEAHPDRYSLLYVPKPFVIPGGRFREFYYWDAYWVIKGLLVSGMHNASRNMIENFVHMVNKYGFVPNGGRVYYLRRSQPPMLTSMAYEYYEATHDIEFIQQILPTLEKELHFWDTKRMVKVWKNGKGHDLYQYRTESNVPRPESYREDVALTKQMTKVAEQRQVWQNLASAAESGWDFSSRWMNDSTKLSSIQTTAIVPVDLNSYMCWNFNILSYLFAEIDDMDKSIHYQERYNKFLTNFQRVFYVKKESGWYDFNMKTGKNNFDFYASVATPLFTRCYHSINLAQSENIFRRMDELGVFNFAGGIPTSLNKDSEQQWDYPNGWSPLNHMVIEGLRRSENPIMQQKAFWLAEKWVLSNYRVFMGTRGKMWEKYNVIGTKPEAGVGGEYDVQSGFGWTNGVILDLLVTYSDRMHFAGLAEHPDQVADDVISNPEPSTLPPRLQAELDPLVNFQLDQANATLSLSGGEDKVNGTFNRLNHMKEELKEEVGDDKINGTFSRLSHEQVESPLPSRFGEDDYREGKVLHKPAVGRFADDEEYEELVSEKPVNGSEPETGSVDEEQDKSNGGGLAARGLTTLTPLLLNFGLCWWMGVIAR